MSRLKELFSKKKQGVLNIYCTAGFPELESTIEVIKALQEHGADMVEIGIPYSDPLADGPVIQDSSLRAIQNGMTLPKLFEQLVDLRRSIHIPLVLMGYMNTVLQYGFEKFCADARTVGIDGIILPDMPAQEFEETYKAITAQYGLDVVFLVTPETTMERVKLLDSLSSGFLYAVSASAVTGATRDFSHMENYLKRLQGYQLSNPVMVGFGISNGEDFENACANSAGAIVGSAYIKALNNTTDVSNTTKDFIRSIIG